MFAIEDMSPGMNSEGGYGCVVAGNYRENVADLEPILTSVDVHWLISNGFERHVKLERLTVVSTSMSCCFFALLISGIVIVQVPTLRPRKVPKQQEVVAQMPSPIRTQIRWLEYGLQTRRHETNERVG